MKLELEVRDDAIVVQYDDRGPEWPAPLWKGWVFPHGGLPWTFGPDPYGGWRNQRRKRLRAKAMAISAGWRRPDRCLANDCG